MANKKSVLFDKVLPTLYSVGAAVVIFGAWAKILHKDFADVMLTIGLLTEAVIFLAFAAQTFFQDNSEYEWEKVYPELSADYKGGSISRSENNGMVSASSLTASVDAAMANAKITPDIFENLGKSMKGISETVSKMGDITDATVATNEYAKNIKAATTSVADMSKAANATLSAANEMTSATNNTKEFRAQFDAVTKNMGALNAVYELELQDTNKHLKAMNSFYGGLSNAMSNMDEASKDTQQFKNELAKLNSNLNSLNSVYGSMLTAMKG
jgi:gliding motility-associated protein GldL